MVLMRTGAPSTYCLAPPSGKPPLLPIPLPTSSLPLPLPSTDRRADVPEVTSTRGFRADYGFVGTLDAEIRRDPDREAQYMDASDTARSEVRALRTIILAQQTKIRDLRVADRRRQAQLVEALTLLRTLQTEMVVLQSQQRPARDPGHPDVPEEASSSS
ncbi:hypothetical protein Tco_1217341 [Tanacetum coccineum]